MEKFKNQSRFVVFPTLFAPGFRDPFDFPGRGPGFESFMSVGRDLLGSSVPIGASPAGDSAARKDRSRWTSAGRSCANDMTFVGRAAIAGAGIALLPRLVGDIAVSQGDLCAVPPELETVGMPLYLTYPSSAHVPLAVRALPDHLLHLFPQ